MIDIVAYGTIFYMYGVEQPLRYVKFAKKAYKWGQISSFDYYNINGDRDEKDI